MSSETSRFFAAQFNLVRISVFAASSHPLETWFRLEDWFPGGLSRRYSIGTSVLTSYPVSSDQFGQEMKPHRPSILLIRQSSYANVSAGGSAFQLWSSPLSIHGSECCWRNPTVGRSRQVPRWRSPLSGAGAKHVCGGRAVREQMMPDLVAMCWPVYRWVLPGAVN